MATLLEMLAEKKRLQEVVQEIVVKAIEQVQEYELVPEPVVQEIVIQEVALVEAIQHEMSIDPTILKEAELVTADIIPRIRQLASLSDIQTENEMKLLKAALMANPQAVSLMLPEDVGMLVVALRRITKEAILAEVEKKAKGKTKVAKMDITKLSKEDLLDVTDF